MIGQSVRVVLARKNQPTQLHAKTTEKVSTSFDEKYRSYKVVFEPYKEDTAVQRYFYVLYSARIYLYFVFFSYLINYPTTQALFMFVLNLVALLCIIITRPLKTKLKYVQYIVQESIMLIITVLILITAGLGSRGQMTENSKATIGYLIIACYFAFLLFSTLMMLVQIIMFIVDVARFIRNHNAQKQVKPFDEQNLTDQEAAPSSLLENKTISPERSPTYKPDRGVSEVGSPTHLLRPEDQDTQSSPLVAFPNSPLNIVPAKPSEPLKKTDTIRRGRTVTNASRGALADPTTDLLADPSADVPVSNGGLQEVVVEESKPVLKKVGSQMFDKDAGKMKNKRLTLKKRTIAQEKANQQEIEEGEA